MDFFYELSESSEASTFVLRPKGEKTAFVLQVEWDSSGPNGSLADYGMTKAMAEHGWVRATFGNAAVSEYALHVRIASEFHRADGSVTWLHLRPLPSGSPQFYARGRALPQERRVEFTDDDLREMGLRGETVLRDLLDRAQHYPPFAEHSPPSTSGT
jgi:hypothetical protein